MKVLALNPPLVQGFHRSDRCADISRGRVQRHPDYMLLAVAVLENAGHEVGLLTGLLKVMIDVTLNGSWRVLP